MTDLLPFCDKKFTLLKAKENLAARLLEPIEALFLIARYCKNRHAKIQSWLFIECFLIALNCALLRSNCD